MKQDEALEALRRAHRRQQYAWRLYKRTLRQYAADGPEALAAWENYLAARDVFTAANRTWREATGVAA